jgi:hypothetical protein
MKNGIDMGFDESEKERITIAHSHLFSLAMYF